MCSCSSTSCGSATTSTSPDSPTSTTSKMKIWRRSAWDAPVGLLKLSSALNLLPCTHVNTREEVEVYHKRSSKCKPCLCFRSGQRRLWEAVKRRRALCKRKSWMSKVQSRLSCRCFTHHDTDEPISSSSGNKVTPTHLFWICSLIAHPHDYMQLTAHFK